MLSVIHNRNHGMARDYSRTVLLLLVATALLVHPCNGKPTTATVSDKAASWQQHAVYPMLRNSPQCERTEQNMHQDFHIRRHIHEIKAFLKFMFDQAAG